MLFNSVQYLVFLPIVVLIYYLIPNSKRWIVLLLASYLFYSFWELDYVLLLIGSTLIFYFSALGMERSTHKYGRKLYLSVSLLCSLFLLLFFKHFDFFSENTQELLHYFHMNIELPKLSLILPLALSFYILQALSYSFDVYHKKIHAEKHLGYFALYLAFFPKLLAGPLERYEKLNIQFRSNIKFDYKNFSHAFRLILYALFIKQLVADPLFPIMNDMIHSPGNFNGMKTILGMFLISLRVYADFYAYSLIAIGSARLFDIRLSNNFYAPYFSRSMADFWRRWHTSLYLWGRDYVYIPLQRSRKRGFLWFIIVLFMFIGSALWYGSGWNYLLWALFLATIYLIEYAIKNSLNKKMQNGIKAISIFQSILVFAIISISWIFFFSVNSQNSFILLKGIFNMGSETSGVIKISLSHWIFLLAFVFIELLIQKERIDLAMAKIPVYLRWIFYFLLLSSILIFGTTDYIPFIFFSV